MSTWVVMSMRHSASEEEEEVFFFRNFGNLHQDNSFYIKNHMVFLIITKNDLSIDKFRLKFCSSKKVSNPTENPSASPTQNKQSRTFFNSVESPEYALESPS